MKAHRSVDITDFMFSHEALERHMRWDNFVENLRNAFPYFLILICIAVVLFGLVSLAKWYLDQYREVTKGNQDDFEKRCQEMEKRLKELEEKKAIHRDCIVDLLKRFDTLRERVDRKDPLAAVVREQKEIGN